MLELVKFGNVVLSHFCNSPVDEFVIVVFLLVKKLRQKIKKAILSLFIFLKFWPVSHTGVDSEFSGTGTADSPTDYSGQLHFAVKIDNH